MLSYLQASLRISHFLTTMKSNPKPLKPSRPIPIASPHKKLKSKSKSHGHPPLASKPPTNTTNPNITLSGRAGPRIGSGQQVRAMKSLAGDEGGLSPSITSSGRAGPRIGSGQQVRAMKSLAGDDEGGLSDWVSSLSKQGSKGRGRDVEVGDKKKDKRRKESGKSYRAVESGFGVKNVGGGRSERVFGGSREAGRFGRGGKSDMGRGGMRSNVGKGKGFGLKDDDDDDDDEVETNEPNWYGSFKELMDSDEEEKDEGDDEEEEEDVDKFNKESVLAWRQREDTETTSPSTGDSYLTQSRFDRFSVSSSTMKGLKDLGYETMTVVQEATLPVILKGKDVMAKARTGTGKTVAFLLPAIELIAKSPPVSRDQKRPPILVLIVCPTRELACQAAAEADKLLKYHLSLGVQVIIGGTRLSLEQKRMQANPCQIIVATPGRLKDHIDNTSGFAIRLSGLKVLVLDEADHLLEMGFRKDIERIVAAVPKDRQTLLFSATIPPEVKQICHIALKKDYKYINTVEEGSEETHTQVRQSHLVAKMDNHFPLLYSLLKDHIEHNVDYKVLVFCTTAMVTRLIAELLGELNLNVREIHSRKSQSYRTKVSDEFRKSTGLILVTSDVSARGVDYPDVTLVIQLGMPADRQQYIHRLGRTGRKGKEGQGILLLAPFEEFFLSTIKDLPITKAPIPSVDPESKKKLERSLSKVGMQEKETAYQAWLGYYNSSKIGKDKYRLVELANEFSRTMGLDKPPAIASKILGKMGLKNIPGLRSK